MLHTVMMWTLRAKGRTVERASQTRRRTLFDALGPPHEACAPTREDEEPRGGEGASSPLPQVAAVVNGLPS